MAAEATPENGAVIRERAEARLADPEVVRSAPRPEVGIRPFYPDAEELPPALLRTLEALAEGARHAGVAAKHAQMGDLLEADDCIHRVQRCMERAFLAPSLSDGLDSVLAAVHVACRARGAGLITDRQAFQIAQTLSIAEQGPFLSVESALPLVENLEEAGLVTVLPELSDLASAALDE